jgi:multidrug transporter EmrE-like cation transporter
MTTTAPYLAEGVAPGASVTPRSPIIRDIARGGLAGAVVGLAVAGLGGRVVMRLAALLVPAAAGSFTENGNRIGDLTVSGTSGLMLFGLITGLLAAPIWVAVSPWLPGIGLQRAALMVPVALATGTPALIEGDNPDFVILRHDPLVVVSLLVLVAVFGAALALVDDLLDLRLPPATGPVGTAYGVLAAFGLALVLPVTVLGFLNSSDPARVLVGAALIAVGIATLTSWVVRIQGRPKPAWLTFAGRTAVALAVILGSAGAIPEVSEALDL